MNVAHRVNRTVFALDFPDEPTAFRVRHALERVFPEAIQPALGEALDLHSVDPDTSYLERVEVDLGELREEEIDTSLGKLVRDRLARALGERVAEGGVAVCAHSVTVTSALTDFLQRGALPWPSPFDDVRELQKAALSLDVPEAREVFEAIRPALRGSGASSRFVLQFSQRFVERVVGVWHPSHAQALLAWFRSPFAGPDAPAERRAALLSASARAASDSTLPVVLHEMARVISGDIGLDAVDSAWAAGQIATPGRLEEIGPVRTPQPLEDRAADGTKNEAVASLTTRYAGVVLVHPFLEALFREVGLVDPDGRFISRHARLRAVHLLHYLTTGQEETDEPGAALFKLLCGLRLSDPIPREPALSESERAEAVAVVAAVLGHWRKLGRTTIDTLRAEFIQRPGTLREEEGGWRLAVERRSIDVILAYLPWTISTISLPWMRDRLRVDWA